MILAGLVLGMGQAGFLDGIVIHQLLQWHHMFSSIETDATVAGLELNTLGDGLFHLLDWVLTLTGIALLWRVAKHEDVSRSTPLFLGALLLGFGLFNLVEGLVNHQLLGIHHVRAGANQAAYDIGFLLISAVIFGLGGLLMQRDRALSEQP